MSENREISDRPIHEVAKLDQVRNVASSALLRTIPASQQTRFMMATPVQSSTAIISSTSTIQAQVLPKVTVQGSAPAQINRLSAAVPLQVSSTAAGYHVPRGAAAVANIAVPRSSVATPIVRGPATLQTIGVAAAPTHPISGGTVSTTGPIVGRSVVGVTPWVTNSLAQQVSARQTPSPAQHQTRPISSSQQQIQVNAATSRMVSGQMRPVGDSQQARPVLLHTTTHKQITLTQQAQLQSFVEGTQTNTGEKTVAVKSYGASACNQGTRAGASASASNLSRLTTALPPAVVSLQPAVIVPTTQTFPVKGSTTTQAKVITQQAHGTTMQISTVPMNSVQPAIAINTVVSRPGVVAVMLTSQAATSGTAVPPTVAMRGMAPQQHVKVYSSAQANSNTSTNSVNTGSSTNTVGNLSADAVTVSAPTPVYIHATQHKTAPSQPTAPASAILVRPPHHQIKEPVEHQGLMSGSQGVRINSLMVVDPARVQVHPFVSSEGVAVVAESGIPPTAMGTLLSGTLSHSLITKQNTSPRPSILRKRDPPEGSPLKAQKNLTPVLASMASSSTLSSNYSISPPPNSCGPLVAPGSPRLPEHAGGGGGSGQSSSSSSGTGSTTLSANSSPGESPTIKLESQEDQDTPIMIPATPTVTTPHQHQEMSPRKKPRKQQLTGNQITEPTFSEDEMEFISEDKVKIEPKAEENEEKCLPKRTMSLLTGYRHPWKSRNNHFSRYSDIRPKEERKPTLSELANQKHALQKLNGWKIYHLNSQMEDMVNSETEFFGLYTSLLSSLEIKQKKCKNKDLDREIGRVSERIRANFQRSKVLKDQIQEAKLQVMKLFEHKGYVADIINRNVTKQRPAKKRERI